MVSPRRLGCLHERKSFLSRYSSKMRFSEDLQRYEIYPHLSCEISGQALRSVNHFLLYKSGATKLNLTTRYALLNR